jgi:glutamate carboxypeptidase
MPSDPDQLRAIGAHLERALPAYLAELERLVNVDCGSYNKAGVDEVGRWVATRLRELGADLELRPHERVGDTIVATFDGTPGGAHLLTIGHLDTVFPDGTVAERPFAIRDGHATGPGVTDMKAGLLTGLHALAAIRAAAIAFPFARLTFVVNGDEELGSPASNAIVRGLARRADAALVLECARANGDIVSARKGILDVRLTIRGRAAHAGVEPEKGRSAILEAAHQVLALQALNGRWPGVTVNVGRIEGGTRPNVVPERCLLAVDARGTTVETFEAAAAEIQRLAGQSTVPDTTIEVERGAHLPPMERLPGAERLIDHAQSIARSLGFEVRDAATGGGGDANFAAAEGTPTLDGLGPIGGNDHSPAEYLEISSIVPRTTLFAGMLLAVGRDPQVAGWAATRAARSR